MMSIATFIAIGCFVFAGFLVQELVRNRGKLYSRIIGLAPGATGLQNRPKMKRLSSLSGKNSDALDFELIEIVAMLVAVLQSGQSLFIALERLTQISNSVLAGELRAMVKRVELGGGISAELSALCERVPTDAIREFSNKLSLAIARGTPLAESLHALCASLRSKHSANQLRRAGANETKMLIPVVLLICPVTVIFALYPSSQFLALGL
ncbi:MAG: hypothetical protein RLZZ471_257 [Actinomycetota bacterium]|jgi:tight adherence protein C